MHDTAIAEARHDRILRPAVVLERVGLKAYSTLYRWARAGRFPKPVSIGTNAIGWRESDLEAWIASREAR